MKQQLIYDALEFVSWAIPRNPLKYTIQRIGAAFRGLRRREKVQKNAVLLATSIPVIIVAGLVPTIIAPDTLGHYVNNLFTSIFGLENIIVLDTLSVVLCSSVSGSITLILSKEVLRAINKYRYGDTNSEYHVDEKRIQKVAEHYIEEYQGIRLELIAEKVKEDLGYMDALIKEKQAIEKSLSKSMKEFKENPKYMEIASPKDPQTKADIKLIRKLYIRGDNRPFKAHLLLYPKIQSLYMEHWKEVSSHAYIIAKSIESRFPQIAPMDQLEDNPSPFKRRKNIVPALSPPLHPLFDIMSSYTDPIYHEREDEEKDAELTEVRVDGGLDDAATNPFIALQPYIHPEIFKKGRSSFRPKIDEQFVEELKALKQNMDEIIEKATIIVEDAKYKKDMAEDRAKPKRKTL